MDLLRQVNRLRLASISLMTGFIITFCLTTGSVHAQNRILEMFGLKSGEMITINPERMGKSELAIQVNRKDYVIDYAFHSIRSKDFRLLVQNEHGELVEETAPTVSTIRGSLRGVDGSSVTGCVSEDGCCAKIEFPTGENYFIEPVNRKIDNPAFAGVHVVYNSEDVIADGLQCGTVTTLAEDVQIFASESNDVLGGTLYEVQTIIDADYEYFSIFGTRDATNRQMEMLLNIANRQYESQANIRFTVASSIVRQFSNDPYTSSFGPTFLDEIETEYQGTSIVADVCHVFTGKNNLTSRNSSGNIIGISGIARTLRSPAGESLPSVCTASGISISRDRATNTLHAATVAHELGHNFSLPHCEIAGCSGHTMQTPSNGALSFHSSSLNRLINARNSLSCLSTFGNSGNGFGLIGNVESNDDLINANIIPNLDFSASGNNFNMTTEAEEPDLLSTGSTVWCYIIPDERGTLTLDTFGSDFDTQLQVYESAPGGFGALSLVDGGSDDDTFDPATGSFLQSQVVIDVTAGTRYEIRVGGWRSSSFIGAGAEGNIDLNGTFAIAGDFNNDGVVDGTDVDFYVGNLGQPATGATAQLDLDGDGQVTLADHDSHVTTLAETSNGITGALLGDVNLDGAVDVLTDAFALVANLGQNAISRSQGDLDANGFVDVLSDAFRLVGQLGQSN